MSKRKPAREAENAAEAAERFDNNPEWTREDFARARPASAVHGPEIASALTMRRGRPPKAAGERKEAVSIRLSPDVLAHFRSGGEGWQTRIDEALRAAMRQAAAKGAR